MYISNVSNFGNTSLIGGPNNNNNNNNNNNTLWNRQELKQNHPAWALESENTVDILMSDFHMSYYNNGSEAERGWCSDNSDTQDREGSLSLECTWKASKLHMMKL